MKRWMAVLGCILILNAPSRSQNDNAQNDFDRGSAVVCIIDNTQQWTNTHITLHSGDTVIVLVRGIAAPNGSTVPSTIFWVGPEGWGGGSNAGNPVPTAANYSVVGRIGTSGTPFYVGNTSRFLCKTSGVLFLGTNDANSSDNSGYYIAQILADNRIITTGLKTELSDGRPATVSLDQNYPNPFNPSTTIRFGLNQKSEVQLSVFNTLGQLVQTLVRDEQEPGYHEVTFNAHGLPSGVYFYRIQAGSFTETKRLLLVK